MPAVHRPIGVPYDERVLPQTYSAVFNHSDSESQDEPDR